MTAPVGAAVEAFKGSSHGFWCESRAGILNLERDRFGLNGKSEADAAVRWRVPQSVVQKVAEDLIQALLIGVDSGRFCWQVQCQFNLSLCGFDQIIRVKALQKILHGKIGALELQCASLGE